MTPVVGSGDSSPKPTATAIAQSGSYQNPFQIFDAIYENYTEIPLMGSETGIDYFIYSAEKPLEILKKIRVSCENIPRTKSTMVALTFGQSNSANYARARDPGTEKHVYNLFKNRCYQAADPMLGAASLGGSVWPQLGSNLIESKIFDDVLFITVGGPGSTIAEWSPETNKYFRKVQNGMRWAKDAGFGITHVLYHQGESDNNSNIELYKKKFLMIVAAIRQKGVKAPVLISQTSYCHEKRDNDLISAQKSLANPELGIYEGPNTDTITDDISRYDGCHFSEVGIEQFSILYLDAIKKMKNISSASPDQL